MQKLIEAVIAAMQAAGFSVQRSGNAAKLGKLSAAKTAVRLKSSVCEGTGNFQYLGMQTMPNGLSVPLYGCRLRNELGFQIFVPRTLGAAACSEEAERVMQFLLGGIDGVQLKSLKLAPCVFEPEADVFSAELTAVAEGYLYAAANEDDTEFTDFILKGEIQ